MTTSTPLFCRAALFRHHATGGTLQIGGDWSIGFLRSNRRLVAGLSHSSSFAPHTFQHWQGPADLVGRQPLLAAYGWWFPTLKKSISANEVIRGRRPFDSESLVAIASSGSRCALSDHPHDW
jgi:hypothetical protein